jgi:hypothetical protein
MGGMGGGVNVGGVSAPVSMTIQAASDPHETAAIVKQTLEASMSDVFQAATLQITVAGGA